MTIPLWAFALPDGYLHLANFLVNAGANLFIQSAILIAVGLALTRFLRRRGSAVQSVVLRGVLVALILSPILSLILSKMGLSIVSLPLPRAEWSATVEPGVIEEASVGRPEDISSRTTISGLADGFGEEAATGTSARVRSLPPLEAVASAAVSRGFTSLAWAYFVLSGLWIAGTSGLFAWLVVCHIMMAKLRRRARSAPEECLRTCQSLANLLEVKCPKVVRSQEVKSPLLTGLFSPVIIFPDVEEVEETVASDAVFIHELAHLKRRDCLWNLIARTLSSLLFYQPLIRLLARKAEEVSDDVCDDYVIRYGCARKTYARQLTYLAQRFQPGLDEAAVGAGVVRFRSSLGRRVVRILDASRRLATATPRRTVYLAAFGVLIGAVLAGTLGFLPMASAPKPITVAEKAETPSTSETVSVAGRVVNEKGEAASVVRAERVEGKANVVEGPVLLNTPIQLPLAVAEPAAEGEPHRPSVLAYPVLEFKQAADGLKAVLSMKCGSWPRTRWKAHVQLVDAGGRTLGGNTIYVKNSGIIETLAREEEATAQCSFHHVKGLETAERFMLWLEKDWSEVCDIHGTVSQADWDSCLESLMASLEAAGGWEEFDRIVLEGAEPPQRLPAPGVVVTLQGNSVTRRAVTDAEGKFQFIALPNGEYELHAEKPAGSSRTGEKQMTRARERVKLDGDSSFDLELSTDRASIRGRITDVDGRPVAGAKVTAIQVPDDHFDIRYPRTTYSTVSNADGFYELQCLEPTGLYHTFGYLRSGSPHALDYVDIRVEADGFVQAKEDVPRVPLVTEKGLYWGRRFLRALARHSEDLREKEGPSLPSIQGNTITGVDIVLDRASAEAVEHALRKPVEPKVERVEKTPEPTKEKSERPVESKPVSVAGRVVNEKGEAGSLEPSAQPESATGKSLEFAPVIESELFDVPGRPSFIDFDTGDVYALPANMESKGATFERWLETSGIDAHVDVAPPEPLRAWLNGERRLFHKAIAAERWDTISPEEVRELLAQPNAGLHVRIDPAEKLEEILAFRTSEGGIGVLQILGFTDDQKGVRIRYKMVQGVSEEAGSAPVVQPKTEGAETASSSRTLQELIDAAKPGGIVTISPGIYKDPITIEGPLTLKGESPETCILELTADEPAILISSRDPVVIDSVTIKWQLATSEGHKGPICALAVRDGTATIRNCRFIALGTFKRCPSAVQCLGFSNVKLERCRFEGFEFTIGYTGGAEGSITDCVVLNPGHCGITVYSGSKLDVARNIVTGSGYHGLRCTGGTLLAHDNLIIKNKNRGIYLGNKSARGKVSNNVIMSNGSGISGFARSDVLIENNVILDSSFGGLGSRDSCPLTVRNNVFQGNTRGIIIFKEQGRNMVAVGQNSFWMNETDTENFERPTNSILVDPRFEAPEKGNFSPQADELKTNKQGLSNPSIFGPLWQKWKAISQEL